MACYGINFIFWLLNLLPFSSKTFLPYLPFKNTNIKIYQTIILPAGLYGCKTRFMSSQDEQILTMCENGGLRRTSGSKKNEIIGG
jgi:hypothetical protein